MNKTQGLSPTAGHTRTLPGDKRVWVREAAENLPAYAAFLNNDEDQGRTEHKA